MTCIVYVNYNTYESDVWVTWIDDDTISYPVETIEDADAVYWRFALLSYSRMDDSPDLRYAVVLTLIRTKRTASLYTNEWNACYYSSPYHMVYSERTTEVSQG